MEKPGRAANGKFVEFWLLKRELPMPPKVVESVSAGRTVAHFQPENYIIGIQGFWIYGNAILDPIQSCFYTISQYISMKSIIGLSIERRIGF